MVIWTQTLMVEKVSKRSMTEKIKSSKLKEKERKHRREEKTAEGGLMEGKRERARVTDFQPLPQGLLGKKHQ